VDLSAGQVGGRAVYPTGLAVTVGNMALYVTDNSGGLTFTIHRGRFRPAISVEAVEWNDADG
jgi:DNA-binding beta-propeller fold protein YncE